MPVLTYFDVVKMTIILKCNAIILLFAYHVQGGDRGDVGTVKLVGLDYRLLVPIGPVQRVLERGYAERVR